MANLFVSPNKRHLRRMTHTSQLNELWDGKMNDGEKKNCLGKNWTTNETKTRYNIYLLIIVKDIPRTSFCPQKWNEDENKLKWMETRISRKQTI